jgi:hypothetical protein
MKTKFDYQEFRSLSMSDLVDYMEPIVNDPETAIVDPSDLRSVAADLESFDEYHLVYAIELGINFMPALFALPTAQLLTHRCQSVRLAAHRGLLGLTSQAISDDVINACQAAIASGAPIHEIGDLPGILRDRLALTIV